MSLLVLYMVLIEFVILFKNDGHIFVTEGQIQQELSAVIDLLHEVYADFGLIIHLSLVLLVQKQLLVWWSVDKSEKSLSSCILDSAELDWE